MSVEQMAQWGSDGWAGQPTALLAQRRLPGSGSSCFPAPPAMCVGQIIAVDDGQQIRL